MLSLNNLKRLCRLFPVKNIRPYFARRKGGAIDIAEIIPNEPDTVSTVEGNFLSAYSTIRLYYPPFLQVEHLFNQNLNV